MNGQKQSRSLPKRRTLATTQQKSTSPYEVYLITDITRICYWCQQTSVCKVLISLSINHLKCKTYGSANPNYSLTDT